MKSKAERWADELDQFGFALDSEKDIAAELRRLAAVEAELERIKALEPVVWANPYGGFLSDSYMKNHATGLEKQTHTVPLYALGSKTNE